MENNNIENNNMVNRSGKVWAGLFIIGVGSILLLKNFGLDFPHWLFRWHTLLIVIGLFIGLKHRFQHSGWIVITLIGTYFTLEDALDLDLNFSQVTLPIMLVGLGLYMILKPKSNFNRHKRWERRCERRRRRFGFNEAETFVAPDDQATTDQKASNSVDYLDSVNVFGGSHQTVYSKNFKGGEVVAVFGGCDLNLTQADFDGTIEIDITAIFGGCKIVVPSGWQVKSEVTAIFGGLDDKRSVQPIVEGSQKLLIVKGIAMFGGVEIRSF